MRKNGVHMPSARVKKIVGLIGSPVGHSLSPEMHNQAYVFLGLDMFYAAFEVCPKDLGNAVKGMEALGFAGFNVTIPHKETIIQYLDQVSEEAGLIGAVNTVVIKEGLIRGYNTDGIGFIKSLEDEGINCKNKRIIILGAGGAARAVAVAAALNGAAAVTVANRTLDRAQGIADVVRKIGIHARAVPFGGFLSAEEAGGHDIIVNATPVGMYPQADQSPIINLSDLQSSLAVCDLIYRPLKTKLIKAAECAGSKTVSGLGMLLHQGAEAFRLFTDSEPPLEVMRESLIVAD